MSRVIAVVVAVGLIAGAVLVRRALDDDRSEGESSSTVRVVCADELRAACEDLDLGRGFDIVVQDAAKTADALATSATDIDVWAVPAPWPAMVDELRSARQLAPRFDGAAAPIARSRFVVMGPLDLDGCDWRCIGDRAEDGLTFGAPPPSSGHRLLLRGVFAAGWFGRADFATNDFEFDSEFAAWLRGIGAATKSAPQPVTRRLQAPFFGAALSFEAAAAAAFDAATPDRKAGLDLFYPAPVTYLDVVVVGVDGALDGSTADVPSKLATALHDRGWEEPSSDPSGLPRPGVLVALRALS